jgi:hypothetical protein
MKRKQEAQAIRAELAQLEHRGRGRAYPEALRKRMIAYVEARRTEGASTRVAGDEIGMDWRTLLRWAPCSTSAGFERVVVRGDAPSDALASPARLVVHAPGGLRIEGLSLEALAELVRKLA